MPKVATPQLKTKRPTKPAASKPAGKVGKKPTPKAAPMKFGPRKDLGAPVEGFFAKQPPQLRAILDQLRSLIAEAAPEATAATKWGMPFYSVGANMMCAMAAFKAHVNLILPGPPGTYPDPDGLLEGDGKTGKHLKLRPADALPRAAVRGWLRTAAARARI
ncbi:MAG TPA: DUF1801 domain-containing protein [Polyangia bacterium]|nr:DUF1801 domain-containing protein [Polyangia bacterium]